MTCPAPGCDQRPVPGHARCWIHQPTTQEATVSIDLEAVFAYPQPAERQPGEFARHPHTGAPYVAHPTETVKRSGLKAELLAEAREEGIQVPPGVTVKTLQELLPPKPKKVMYGRPSGLGKQIENATNLQKWAERMVALGIATDLSLADEARRLVELDPESPEFRDAADKIASAAKKCAGATLAAERGTHHHELTEDFDQERDPIARMAAGEDLGVPVAAQHALLEAWDRMLLATGLEILVTEATVVDDKWRQAGTLDRIARLTRALCFVTGEGETVELPVGTVIVLDLKTGKLRFNDRGHPLYWHTYSVQVASYAQSVPYDPDTDERGEWPWPLEQQWGIIAHLDVRAALDGEAVCQLIAVDLEAGRHAGELCVAAKEWERRCGLFGAIADGRVAVPVSSPRDPTPISEVLPAAVAEITKPATTPGFRAVVERRLKELKPEAAALLRQRWPADVPGMKGGHVHTDAELQRILGALEAAEAETAKPAQPDEGSPAPDDRVDAVLALIGRFEPTVKAVLEGWAREAHTAGVGFSIKVNRSQRRLAIYRALIALSELVEDDGGLDLCRATVAEVVADAAQPTIPLGAVIGALTIAEAERVAELARLVRSSEPALTYHPDSGAVRWAFPNSQTAEQDQPA